MADATPLSVIDAESAQNAVLKLLLSYPQYPASFTADNTTVKWGGTSTGQSIGLIPLQGAIYIKRYISGSYVAQMPFLIVYQSSPTTNKATITAETLLEQIARWLNACEIAFDDKRFTLEAVEQTSPIYPYDVDEKLTAVAVQMQLRYNFKK